LVSGRVSLPPSFPPWDPCLSHRFPCHGHFTSVPWWPKWLWTAFNFSAHYVYHRHRDATGQLKKARISTKKQGDRTHLASQDGIGAAGVVQPESGFGKLSKLKVLRVFWRPCDAARIPGRSRPFPCNFVLVTLFEGSLVFLLLVVGLLEGVAHR
jgi:hypothetical protein